MTRNSGDKDLAPGEAVTGAAATPPGGEAPRPNRRVLIIDDNQAIHRDFHKILIPDPPPDTDLTSLEEELFGEALSSPAPTPFEVDDALQGEEGFERVVEAQRRGMPYAMAFVDVRMPPGWDGVETIQQIWRVDSTIQIVICTAYSDYSWSELTETLGESDRLLILRKPFDKIEVRQLAVALCAKWQLLREKQSRLDDLEALVQARTRELEAANEKLRDEMAERLRMEQELRESQKLQALGRLSEGMRHEINNPLCFVSGNLEFIEEELAELAEGVADERLQEVRGAVGEAITGAGRIQNILRDVKLYARADDTTGGPVNLERVLDTVSNLIEPDMRHRARLVNDARDLPPVLGEAQRLEQVFLNLLLNASQAIPVGRADDNEIRIAASVDADGFARVVIRDTGQGIPREQLNRVFEPFYTTRPVGQGTGLGLSICRTVVTAFGGSIGITSEVARGTEVTVRLPLASKRMATDAGRRSLRMETAPGEAAEDIPDTLHILLIDDEPLILELLRRSLRQHTLHLAGGGHQALEILASQPDNQPIDLIFCDLMMPDMTGMELFHQLCQDYSDLVERVVFITGGAFSPHIRRFLLDASNHCIEKPFARSEILRVVEAYREGRL